MKPSWVVVVEGSRARIFELTGPAIPMREIADLLNPEMRMAEHEIGSDKPGRTFDSSGRGRHAKQPRTDPSRQRHYDFIHEIAARIEQARNEGCFRDIILVAAPATLGLLRKTLTKAALQCVKREIPKNVVRADEASIRALLAS